MGADTYSLDYIFPFVASASWKHDQITVRLKRSPPAPIFPPDPPPPPPKVFMCRCRGWSMRSTVLQWRQAVTRSLTTSARSGASSGDGAGDPAPQVAATAPITSAGIGEARLSVMFEPVFRI